MFERRSIREILFLTLLFYAGWILVGLSSKWISSGETLIRVSRDMGKENQRWIMTGLAFFNLLIGILMVISKKIKINDLFYIFLTGTLVEFALEFSLLVSGIRLEQGHWSLTMMLINTFIEFNCGIIFMFLIWRKIKSKEIKSEMRIPL
jgi:hypothetical protein